MFTTESHKIAMALVWTKKIIQINTLRAPNDLFHLRINLQCIMQLSKKTVMPALHLLEFTRG